MSSGNTNFEYSQSNSLVRSEKAAMLSLNSEEFEAEGDEINARTQSQSFQKTSRSPAAHSPSNLNSVTSTFKSLNCTSSTTAKYPEESEPRADMSKECSPIANLEGKLSSVKMDVEEETFSRDCSMVSPSDIPYCDDSTELNLVLDSEKEDDNTDDPEQQANGEVEGSSSSTRIPKTLKGLCLNTLHNDHGLLHSESVPSLTMKRDMVSDHEEGHGVSHQAHLVSASSVVEAVGRSISSDPHTEDEDEGCSKKQPGKDESCSCPTTEEHANGIDLNRSSSDEAQHPESVLILPGKDSRKSSASADCSELSLLSGTDSANVFQRTFDINPQEMDDGNADFSGQQAAEDTSFPTAEAPKKWKRLFPSTASVAQHCESAGNLSPPPKSDDHGTFASGDSDWTTISSVADSAELAERSDPEEDEVEVDSFAEQSADSWSELSDTSTDSEVFFGEFTLLEKMKKVQVAAFGNRYEDYGVILKNSRRRFHSFP